MKALRRIWKRVTGVFAGSRRESDLAAEIESHLELQTADNIRLGMSPEQARREAVLRFGGIEAAKESYRDQLGMPSLQTFAQDLRYAARGMRKTPGFTIVAVLSLALGIGASTGMFSVVHGLLLAPLPYADPPRLATITLGGAISAPVFERFRSDSASIEKAALFVNWSASLSGDGEPERIPAARVSADLFPVLGVRPRLGRAFTAEEDQQGRESVVLISDGLWRSRFTSDRSILGRKLILNGAPYTVVGVMPRGFQFPDGPELPDFVGAYPPAQIWRPMALASWERECQGCRNYSMLARLRRGVPATAARVELEAIYSRLVRGEARRSTAPVVTVQTLSEAVTANIRRPVLILLGAVGVALLIACVNVANLLLARGLRRRSEIALRLALGASRGRIVRQLLTEALLLAVCAGVLAAPLAVFGIHGLLAIAPAEIAGLGKVTVDVRVFAIALGLGLATTLFFGALPAVVAARNAPADAMKGRGRNSAGRSPLRRALVTAEVALSLVLMVAASLLARSLENVARTPLGFHAENVLTMRTTLPASKYDEPRRAALIERLASECRALPGVTSAAAVSTLPLTDQSEGWGIQTEDRPNEYLDCRVRAVTPEYFRTLGIRLLSGRDFISGDSGKAPAVILSSDGARRLWPGVADPLGRKLRTARMIAVGIVEATHASGLEVAPVPYLYIPFSQFAPEEFALVVRTAGNPTALAAAVKSRIRRIDKDQPITHVAAMKQLVADSVAPRRFRAVLMSLFAIFALILAALGIYGVVSYSVAQRTHEIGIRLALGAPRASVLLGVMKEAGGLALTGTTIGAATAYLVAPLIRNLLYGIRATDVWAFIVSAVELIGVALVACFLPARKAAKLDPMASLRHE